MAATRYTAAAVLPLLHCGSSLSNVVDVSVSLPTAVYWLCLLPDALQSYPGHRDQVSGLAFRDGSHTLYSCGFDRTVKIWSLDDSAYVDTLFGHQAEVFAVDAARAERVVSVGHDHTCR
jgi:WD40 repeat protein